MESKFYIIEQKLNDFIRKFYSNRLLQGVLLFLATAFVTFFTVFITEYFVYMSPILKTLLFYTLVFIFGFILVAFIIIPLLKIFKIFPVITYDEAAKIISNYFSDSKDTLLNLLQLNKNCDTDADKDLLIAAINQKTAIISPLNFPLAINFKNTLKFLFITLAILLVISILSAVNYSKISSGAERFLNFSTVYNPENPYTFTMLNKVFESGRGDDYSVNVKIDGPTLPSDVFMNVGSVKIRMNEDSAGFYSHNFKNLNSDVEFSFDYLDFKTDNYRISVYDKPQILSFSVVVNPPAYTKISANNFENTGDLTVPYGSNISWIFNVANGNNLVFYTDSLVYKTLKIDDNNLEISKRATKNFNYNFSVNGEKNIEVSSSMFHVNIVPDFYPTINCIENIDSSSLSSKIFMGRIEDDYGFSLLTFNYYYESNPQKIFSLPVEFDKQSVNQDYFYYYDFSNLPENEKISYYFEVKDNDAISGFKSSRTSVKTFSQLSQVEKEQRVSDLHNSMNEKIESTKRLLNELNKDIDDFQKAMSGNKDISEWEKQLKLNNLLDKQNKLQNLLDQLSNENIQKDMFENQLNPSESEELSQKQQEFQELWDKLIDDDVKQLLDKINKLKDSYNDKNLKDKINDLKFDYNQLSEQLERNNQLMKMYNIENNIHKLSDDLSKMSKDYEKFSEEVSNQLEKSRENIDNKTDKNGKNSKNNNQNTDNLDQKTSEQLQNEMNDFLDKLNKFEENYENLLKENNSLGDDKLDIEDIKNNFSDIKNQLEQQKNKLENNDFSSENSNSDNKNDKNNQQNSDKNNKNDGENKNSDNNQGGGEEQNNDNKNEKLSNQMQKTAEEMQEMSDILSGGMNMQQEQKTKENMNDIRQIQDNLLSLSFEQEKLINLNKNILNGSSLQTESIKKQQSLKQDFDLVRDSIYALARREPKLGHAVYEKIADIYHNFDASIEYMNNNNRSSAAIRQQSVMTGVNDLSLLFDDVLNQMQNQQMQQNGGQSQKEIQSKNKKQSQQMREQKFRDMRKGSQSLKQQLQQLMEQLEKGDNPSNQKLVESLKMQEMMQQQIQEMLNNSGMNGKERQLLNQLNRMMEDNKRDIINENVTRETLKRQEQIFNKLLETEKSDREQEYDDKRESNSGKNREQQNKIDLNSLKKLKFGTREFLNSKYIDMDLFYINKYNNYLQNIEN